MLKLNLQFCQSQHDTIFNIAITFKIPERTNGKPMQGASEDRSGPKGLLRKELTLGSCYRCEFKDVLRLLFLTWSCHVWTCIVKVWRINPDLGLFWALQCLSSIVSH